MNKQYLALSIIIVGIILGTIYVLSTEESEPTENSQSPTLQAEQTYSNISARELNDILASRDPYLLDVHTPEQEHISGTDDFIPYTDIEENMSKLPVDKDTEIIVYCRSGSMSEIASEKLIELGYTNVSNVVGGINAWNAERYE